MDWINKTWRDKTWFNETWSDKTWFNKTWSDKALINKTWSDKTWRDITRIYDEVRKGFFATFHRI